MGDNHGKVGMGIGKANAVPDAMRKATDRARKDLHEIHLSKTTIPHQSTAKVGGAIVLLKPASPGTGVIAGGGVRAVLEAVGIHDILTKSLGSSNVLNAVQATLHALEALKSPQEEAARRGKSVDDLLPYWERRKKHG
jgi:small subunit ribosomal protein S5